MCYVQFCITQVAVYNPFEYSHMSTQKLNTTDKIIQFLPNKMSNVLHLTQYV